MNYISRHLEENFLSMSKFFKAVLVTGQRQVGKTTMLKHLAEGQNRTYVSLDDLQVRALAQSDPSLFFQMYKPPIIIDEVQYAPELFAQIKIICDNSEEKGLFWLTGSQQFSMMKNVRESLAGRIGILQLHGFTRNELNGVKFDIPLNFDLQDLIARQKQAKKGDIVDIFKYIWNGSFPQLVGAGSAERKTYFSSYVDTYLMRDIAEIGGVTDSIRFRKFLTACAAETSHQLNYKTLAEAAEISQPTAKDWLKLLEGLNIVFLLQPYSNNALKKLIKTPKLYFYDTGLCAFLASWLTPDALMNGAASGAYFENFVISEMIKEYSTTSAMPNIYYYRDANSKEIDIILEQNNTLYPLEIKKSAAPDSREVKKYEILDKASLKRGPGGILCACESVVPIDKDNTYIPAWIL